ncbi:TlpA family protein disulfide reductase [Ramlibacter sp.]|uniref:TlpA family protein disulfide reductase n=1 Tax=Ramlibacter sp. TaxID=1917967 RepID=UPI0035B24124
MPVRPAVATALVTLLLALGLGASPAPAAAQAAAPASTTATPSLAGSTLEGQPFDLARLRGKVVLVMFWSTGCAVCRDKMPELRQNYAGWAGKPFELVLVSTDRQLADVQAYDAIIARTVPLTQRFVQLWAGAPGFRSGFGAPGTLPAGFLIDKTGRVVERYQGRIPAEAWDRIADLL